MAIAYCNGEFIDAEQALISISDRGFRYGDGLFETIHIAQTEPQQLHRHLKRLEEGLMSLKINFNIHLLPHLIRQLISQNNSQNGVLRIAISRGVGGRGYLPDVQSIPTCVMEILPMPPAPLPSATVWVSTIEKLSLKTLPVHTKMMQGLNATLAAIEAQEKACDDALLLNANGYICEATGSNIFWQIGEQIFSPALECGLLPGIARERFCEYWNVTLGYFTLEDLKNADSVMLCNAITGAREVTLLKPQNWQWNNPSLTTRANELLYAT